MTDTRELLNPQAATNPGRTHELATAIREAVGCLNYATAGPGLSHPGDVYTVLAELRDSAGGLDQTLQQLITWLEDQAQRGRLDTDSGPYADDPLAAVAAAGSHMAQARTAVRSLAHALQLARQTLDAVHTTDSHPDR